MGKSFGRRRREAEAKLDGWLLRFNPSRGASPAWALGGVALCALVLGAVGGATSRWVSIEAGTPDADAVAGGSAFHQGLWELCVEGGEGGGAADADACVELRKDEDLASAWVNAAQAFACIFCFFELMTVYLLVWAAVGGGPVTSRLGTVAAAGMSFMAALSGIIASSLFLDRGPGGGGDLGWSIGLFLAAWCIALLSAPLIVLYVAAPAPDDEKALLEQQQQQAAGEEEPRRWPRHEPPPQTPQTRRGEGSESPDDEGRRVRKVSYAVDDAV